MNPEKKSVSMDELLAQAERGELSMDGVREILAEQEEAKVTPPPEPVAIEPAKPASSPVSPEETKSGLESKKYEIPQEKLIKYLYANTEKILDQGLFAAEFNIPLNIAQSLVNLLVSRNILDTNHFVNLKVLTAEKYSEGDTISIKDENLPLSVSGGSLLPSPVQATTGIVATASVPAVDILVGPSTSPVVPASSPDVKAPGVASPAIPVKKYAFTNKELLEFLKLHAADKITKDLLIQNFNISNDHAVEVIHDTTQARVINELGVPNVEVINEAEKDFKEHLDEDYTFVNPPPSVGEKVAGPESGEALARAEKSVNVIKGWFKDKPVRLAIISLFSAAIVTAVINLSTENNQTNPDTKEKPTPEANSFSPLNGVPNITTAPKPNENITNKTESSTGLLNPEYEKTAWWVHLSPEVKQSIENIIKSNDSRAYGVQFLNEIEILHGTGTITLSEKTKNELYSNLDQYPNLLNVAASNTPIEVSQCVVSAEDDVTKKTETCYLRKNLYKMADTYKKILGVGLGENMYQPFPAGNLTEDYNWIRSKITTKANAEALKK